MSMKIKTSDSLLPNLISIAFYWVPVLYTVGLIPLSWVLWLGVVGTLVLILSSVMLKNKKRNYK